jgi:hypothetical protein
LDVRQMSAKCEIGGGPKNLLLVQGAVNILPALLSSPLRRCEKFYQLNCNPRPPLLRVAADPYRTLPPCHQSGFVRLTKCSWMAYSGPTLLAKGCCETQILQLFG